MQLFLRPNERSFVYFLDTKHIVEKQLKSLQQEVSLFENQESTVEQEDIQKLQEQFSDSASLLRYNLLSPRNHLEKKKTLRNSKTREPFLLKQGLERMKTTTGPNSLRFQMGEGISEKDSFSEEEAPFVETESEANLECQEKA